MPFESYMTESLPSIIPDLYARYLEKSLPANTVYIKKVKMKHVSLIGNNNIY